MPTASNPSGLTPAKIRYVATWCGAMMVQAVRMLPRRAQRRYLRRLMATANAVYELDRKGTLDAFIEATDADR